MYTNNMANSLSISLSLSLSHTHTHTVERNYAMDYAFDWGNRVATKKKRFGIF